MEPNFERLKQSMLETHRLCDKYLTEKWDAQAELAKVQEKLRVAESALQLAEPILELVVSEWDSHLDANALRAVKSALQQIAALKDAPIKEGV